GERRVDDAKRGAARTFAQHVYDELRGLIGRGTEPAQALARRGRGPARRLSERHESRAYRRIADTRERVERTAGDERVVGGKQWLETRGRQRRSRQRVRGGATNARISVGEQGHQSDGSVGAPRDD